MGIRTRLVAAAVVAATVTVGVGVAAADPAPTSPSAPAAGEGKKAGNDQEFAKVAASLHVTVEQLTTALQHLKQAVGGGTDKDTAVAAFAKELGVSVADAEKALQALSSDQNKGKGKGKPDKDHGVPPQVVIKALAAALHISEDRAKQVLEDQSKVTTKGDAVVNDPAFIAIANGLGITPQQLLATLIQVKQQVAQQMEGKPPATK